MFLGLKRGEVFLSSHQPEWAEKAAEIICDLKEFFGDKALNIQHVGSTAIQNIKAKPMLDIAVGVESLDGLDDIFPKLEIMGIFKSSTQPLPKVILCAMKETRESEIVLSNLHIEVMGSSQWKNHVNFRDYMNTFPEKAVAYERIKCQLAEQFPHDRDAYLQGKTPFIKECIFEANIFTEFCEKLNIVDFEPIKKGWSSDKKYYVKTVDNNSFLMRVADISQYEQKKAEFENMKRIADLEIPMQQPVDFGVCNGRSNVYLILTWVDGEDAEEVLPLLPETAQYVLGRTAGKILKEMQTTEVSTPSDDWFNGYGMKVDRYIQNYHNCGLTFEGDKRLIAYIEQNKYLMRNRPMCLTHDDYHPGNLIMNNNQGLFVIDFQRLRMVEPYHALAGVQFSAKNCPHFATGQLNAYFEGEPPEDFWRLLALYMACVAVNALPWSIPFGQEEIDFAYKQIADIMSWYDNMQSIVPTWYIKDFYIQYTDGVPYKMKCPYDFSFLEKYGRVFKVFDDQDSGNICFEVESETGDKYFVKFAGAPTERANISAEQVIQNLKCTVPVYQNLAHPSLIKLVASEEIGGGFAVIFQWVEAECMGRMYPLSRQKFMSMSLEVKKCVFEDVLSFHKHVAKQNYVAIDFYDGSVMYDFIKGNTVICDIDFYARAPYVNTMGRMWGSSRFMSPEEFQLGAVIDEVTSVYTMGAFAFALFADGNRTEENWPLSGKLFAVVKKAISDERSERQQSVRELMEEWRMAI